MTTRFAKKNDDNATKDRLFAFGILAATMIAVGGGFASAATIHGNSNTDRPAVVSTVSTATTADTHSWTHSNSSSTGIGISHGLGAGHGAGHGLGN